MKMSNIWKDVAYLNGFGNEFESEAEGFAGALPQGRANPQRPKFDLFAEQLSGTAFTAPRYSNRRSPYGELPKDSHKLHYDGTTNPNQIRWRPFQRRATINDGQEKYDADALDGPQDFIGGLHTLAHSDKDGSASSSIAIHIYLFETSMENRYFVNSDGDFLFVPQLGTLFIKTEFGRMIVEPNEIAVIQQGMVFSIETPTNEDPMRGYVLEVRGNHFELPYLGPIGANGLANPRDFQIPTAWVEEHSSDSTKSCKLVRKFRNKLFEATQTQSPFDVAAWFGNYTPYKYSLDKFVSVNSVSVDHPDPSIFTVLTCPSNGKPGTALADFVIFPPRWECASDTFRPPYYHRNCMTEFMGLIKGQYQAKSSSFAPGGGSLHQAMMPHGPDTKCFEMATDQDTSQPKRVADGTMAFMFETSLTLDLTSWAREQNVDIFYHQCWRDLI